ncbi:MAG: stage II sporulation protein P [Oscillospiraceae bacterium]|nr:stage II sporulation protein P [Oscillospiraceae bacterium]
MNTDKETHKKSNGGLYIVIIILFIIILRNNVSFLSNLLNVKLNITQAVLKSEIKWLKYYDKTAITTKLSLPGLNLNDGTTITSQNDEAVYNASLRQALDENNPQVYIYHTHTSESFFNVADPIDFKISEEKRYNISGLGQTLCDLLENDYGIASRHDDIVHDEVYVGAYKSSRATLEEALAKYSGYKLIIDMHRDSVDNVEAETAVINGERVAKIMFVLDLSHKGAEKNLKVAQDLIAISDRLFPGLCKGTYTYEGGSSFFNQDLSSNNVLIEVGSVCNTLEEARNSQKYLARIIAEYLRLVASG